MLLLAGRFRYHKSMSFGRMLITLGAVLIVLGLLVSLGPRLPFRVGRLPGDIYIRGRTSVFYFPLMTCLLLSAILSLVVWILRR